MSHFSFVPVLVSSILEFCPFWSFIRIWVLSLFEFCHNLSCLILIFSPFELSQFMFCHKYCFVKISNHHYLFFVTVCVWSHFVFLSQFVYHQERFRSNNANPSSFSPFQYNGRWFPKQHPGESGVKGHLIEFMIILDPYFGPQWTHLNPFGPIES